MIFYTYILWSIKLNKYYTGSSNDYLKRFYEHNKGKSSYTKKGVPWELVYVKEFTTRAEAAGFEKYIKSRKSITYIQNLILEYNK